jgi:hypothetical protein
VLTAALDRAAEYQASNKDILSFGLGFKYSSKAGYGRKAKPCVKFVVNKKAPESKREKREEFIPKSLSFTYRGHTWRLPTDVVEARTAVQHLLRVRPDNYPADQGFGGTPAFIAHDGTSAPPLLVTAGHALRANGNGVVDGQRVLLDPFGSAGSVLGGVTYQTLPDGLHDYGAVRCDAGSPALAFYQSPPWASIHTVIDEASILGMVRDREHPICYVLGSASATLVRFDCRLATGITFSLPGGPVSYAAGLLLFRAQSGGFASGDSGAPIVLGNGVLGLHVVGLNNDPTVSYAVPASAALDALSSFTGRSLKLRW